MESKDLNMLLLNHFPELKEEFDEYTGWQEGIETGSFITYEDVFMPFLEKYVELKNNEMIERIYNFIEELCDIDDPYVQNILYVAILEKISCYEHSEDFSRYLHQKSMKIYLENYGD